MFVVFIGLAVALVVLAFLPGVMYFRAGFIGLAVALVVLAFLPGGTYFRVVIGLAVALVALTSAQPLPGGVKFIGLALALALVVLTFLPGGTHFRVVFIGLAVAVWVLWLLAELTPFRPVELALRVGATLAWAALTLTVIEANISAGGWWIALAWLVTVSLFIGAWLRLAVVLAISPPGWFSWPRRLEGGWFGVVVNFLWLTTAFAALSAVLYGSDAVTAERPIDDPLVLNFWAYYVWSFLDAIPALEIPETLNWSAPAALVDVGSGALLLTYKLLVIVPLILIAREALAARRAGLDVTELGHEGVGLRFETTDNRGSTDVWVEREGRRNLWGGETHNETLGRLAAALGFRHANGSPWNDGETSEVMRLGAPGGVIVGTREGETLILEFRSPDPPFFGGFNLRLDPDERQAWRMRIGRV